MWSSWHKLVAHWRSELHVYGSPDAESAAIRAQHIQTIGRFTPLAMGGNLAGGVLLTVTLWPVLPSWQLLPWLLVLMVVCLSAMANWWAYRRRPRAAVSPQAVNRTVRGALLLSLPWAGATAGWFCVVPQQEQMLLSTVVIGIMCGGAFALASVPQAAAAYLGVMTAGSVLGLARSAGMVYAPLIILVMLYGGLLCLCTLTTARIYTARLVSEREAERQRAWVGLLLRDFEEHSADLPWEVDACGRFTRVSTRLATALCSTSEALHATGLVQALAASPPSGTAVETLAELARAMAEGRPFRDLVVPVQTAAGPRWWSLTGKPLEGQPGQMRGWRGVIADVTPARQARERLEALAHSDSLTGLANRLRLRQRLEEAALVAPAPGDAGRRVALICLDVDHFKSINDTLGHAVGDAVLVEVAQRMRACLRPEDLAARLGGDEFALLIDPALDDAHAQAIAQRLVTALGQPLEVSGQTVPLTVSVGVAVSPEHGRSLDELLGSADLALYAAKEAGRDRYAFFSPRLGDRHRRRVLIGQELRGALDRGELALAWQLQVNIESRQAVGVEVLLRWQHPTLGAVSPAEFIPIAEESGQINAIGTWVLEQACSGAVGLPATVAVSVNASPVQLLRGDFMDTVVRALAASGLPACRLKVEITESLFLEAVPVALANLHGLRQLGVQIALDDFGIGFSSLAYLLRFPFDLLKIDRAFVLEMMARDDARALVRTIVEMARTLGMGTIAEGVEDLAQLEVLRQAGCDTVQGYLVARPMPLAQLHTLLATWSDPPDTSTARVVPLRAGWPADTQTPVETSVTAAALSLTP